jgi:hypothetical protein
MTSNEAAAPEPCSALAEGKQERTSSKASESALFVLVASNKVTEKAGSTPKTPEEKTNEAGSSTTELLEQADSKAEVAGSTPAAKRTEEAASSTRTDDEIGSVAEAKEQADFTAEEGARSKLAASPTRTQEGGRATVKEGTECVELRRGCFFFFLVKQIDGTGANHQGQSGR